MSVLPSPIPHPLEFSPWEMPGWVYEALEWVVGFDWPSGNEVATWDVADRWYALAGALTDPRDDAAAAAGDILAGYSGAGADAFEEAWQGVPLEALIEVAQELGQMVEECGCDIEGAKIEAWIELGLFVIELIGMAVAVAATLGAASPAAGGLIAATRLIIQQIFRRLVEQLSRKALRQAGSRAVKQLSTRAGRMALARGALHEGLDEAREEFATNALIQGYQNTTGRRDGVDAADLGLSAAAGFGGGFAAGGAHVGAGHGQHGVVRGAAGEVLGEFGGAAVTGDLPDLEGMAKSASSGAVGSAMSGGHGLKTGGLDISSLDTAGPGTLSALAGDTPTPSSASSASPTSPLSAPAPDVTAPPHAPLETSHSKSDSSVTDVIRPDITAAASDLADDRVDHVAGGPGESSATRDGGRAPTSDIPGPSSDSTDNPTRPTATPSVGVAPGPVTADVVTAQAPTAAPTSTDPASATSPNSPTPTIPSPSPTPTPAVGLEPSPTGILGTPPTSNTDSPLPPATSQTGGRTPTPTVPSTTAPLNRPSPEPTGAPDLSRSTMDSGITHPSHRPVPDPGKLPRTGPWDTPPGHVDLTGPRAAAATPAVDIASPQTRPSPTHPPTAAGPPAADTAPPRDNPTPGIVGPSVDDAPNRPSSPDARAGVAPPHAGPPPSDTMSPVRPSPDVVPPRDRPGRPDDQDPQDGTPADRPRSDLDLIAAALGPGAPAAPMRDRAPVRAPDDQQQIDAYLGYLRDSRQAFETDRRERDARALNNESESWAGSAGRLANEAADARARGFTLRAGELSAAAREAERRSVVLSAEADLVAANLVRPPRTDVEFDAWDRLNNDVGILAPGGVDTDDRSRVTDDDIPAPVEKSRNYDEPGGLRRPLAVHQKDLERAVPKDHRGRPLRNPDPREGHWFGLANDGGPRADATRGINCVDGVLSLFDTYVHGRPRVSAPRTFDSYAQGEPTRPLNPESGGLSRIEATARGGFVNLTPPDPNPKRAVDQALTNLSRQLLSLEHGAFAFIVTQSEAGDAHAWAAINHGGTVLFLDPQTGKIAEDKPLYTHTGHPNPSNVVAVSALLTNPSGEYSTIPAHLSPTPAHLPDPLGEEAERRAREAELETLAALGEDNRRALAEAQEHSQYVADRTLSVLRGIVGEINPSADPTGPSLIKTESRVKTQGSIARSYITKTDGEEKTLPEFLAEMKDRVRFSIQTPESGYGPTVNQILTKLQDQGFAVDEVESFWGYSGRHNGLNVGLTDPTNNRMEIQFPTKLSYDVGEQTHGDYEVVRQEAEFSFRERVEAFFNILRVNKELGINDRQPSGLELLPVNKTVDTSFKRWLSKNSIQWASYVRALESEGLTLDFVLAQHNLTRDDVMPCGEAQDLD
ncbi:toxin glutamine deamidase domain-containing protein [Actinoplanes sp. NPDC089786]|uniref:toxin glutamine deamidase domain-containing protein n=1 Tax=Actinoplanes sp. NPDC089786 TaxID=3155185 RepID=UPI003445B775